MQRPPARRNAPTTNSTPFSNRRTPKRATQRGLFSNGVWHCDCDPRLPAEHFKVKKDGKNQGRWFYTCQQSEPQRCGFFLWQEDAQVREQSAVLGNSRTETRGQKDVNGTGNGNGKGLFGGVTRGDEGAHARMDDSTESPDDSPVTPASRKRKTSPIVLDEEEDETFPWSPTQGAVRPASDARSFETPKKAQKTGVYATPATSTVKRKLPWLDAEIGTTTANERADNIHTPSKPPSVPLDASHHTAKEPTTPSNPTALPTAASPLAPTRYKNALDDPDDSTSTLTSAVMGVLTNHKINLPASALGDLRSVVTQHDLRTQGITKGREISRLALGKKDQRIAELQERIAGLEADREVDRGLIRALKRNSEARSRV